jgi:tetratricopeptide (TPR) repeat protein
LDFGPARLLALSLLLVGSWAQAQTLGDIDVRAQGDLRIVRIRFNASVGFLQLVPSGEAEFYALRFEMLAADELVLRQAIGESRRVPATLGLPEMVVGYAADPGTRIKQLTVRLSRALPVQARQGPNARSIELFIKMPGLEPAAAAAAASAASAPAIGTAAAEPTEPATPEIEAQAEGLMARARTALAEKQAAQAVDLLNQLLKLPPNSQTVAAQALIGEAWEQNDNTARARAEYALYLKLYPRGEAADKVAARLTALGGPPTGTTATGATVREAPKTWSGSIAQYYYGGKAKTKSLVSIATGIDQSTISRTTESSIVTSLDISGRYAGESGETRAVVRGSGSSNLVKGGHSSSSIGSVYVEHRHTANDFLGGLAVRAGRQSPISGGLLGLFDGVSLAYPVRDGLKLDVMGGVPANALVSSPGERLLAAVLEADTFLERFGGNFYVLDQSTQGISNRRAFGAEVRYAGDRWSLNTVADYDGLFNKINALSAHVSGQVGAQTTVTVLADQRRAPSLQLSNALISSGAVSLKELLQTRTLEQIKSDALATSAMAQQFLISVSRPLNPTWQFSTDLRYSAVGALPAVADFEATQATGAQYSWSAQLTGTNLYSKRDINNMNLSVLSTPFFRGAQFSYNNLTGMSDNGDVTLEPSVRVYWQRDKQEVKLLRVGPGIRLSWRANRRSSLLGEFLYETSRTDSPTNHDTSNSVFFYVGYRYELF